MTFENINKGYRGVFQPGRLTLGLISPMDHYAVGDLPAMEQSLERIRLAEQAGFAAVWLRDIPFNVPNFGDVGQMFDPLTYLGFLAAQTQTIALGVGSLILPLRHPAHIAKAAATVDQLSGGRLLLGVASGDRPDEFPAMGYPHATRGHGFRECFEYIRRMAESYPAFENSLGRLAGDIDMLPKPTAAKVPMLITGGSQQPMAWGATHSDGLITYPRGAQQQAQIIEDWRSQIPTEQRHSKPIMQSLYIDLQDRADAPPEPIHLGFRSGANFLNEYLQSLQAIGVNHVSINLRFNRAPIEETIEQLATQVLENF